MQKISTPVAITLVVVALVIAIWSFSRTMVPPPAKAVKLPPQAMQTMHSYETHSYTPTGGASSGSPFRLRNPSQQTMQNFEAGGGR